jgi:hypothetical protein
MKKKLSSIFLYFLTPYVLPAEDCWKEQNFYIMFRKNGGGNMA